MISQVAGDPSAPATEEPPPARRRSYHIRRVPALDGLRGVAVVGVILFHFGYLKGGYLGVDLFFVLSGFLITSILLVEKAESGRIAYGSFWGRRARRLLPALLLLLLGVAVFARVWARPIDRGAIRGDGLAALLYVANWRAIVSHTDYWAISSAPSPLQHVWSLAIEEQFYLVWPLVVGLILWLSARGPRAVARVAGIGALLFAGLLVFGNHLGWGTTRLYEGTDTRAASLLMGAVVAGICARRHQDDEAPAPSARTARIVVAVVPAAVIVLAACWVFLPGTSRVLYQGMLPLCGLLASVIVYALVALPDEVRSLTRALSVRPLIVLGMLSYGLYLWHWPVGLVVSEVRTGLSGIPLLVARCALTGLLAVVSYYLVERPIRQGTFFDGGYGVVSALAAVVIVACTLLLATGDAVSVGDVNVVNAKQRSERTVAGAPKVLFLGDSVAESLSQYPIEDQSYGIDVYNAAKPGCALVFEGNEVRDDNGKVTRPESCSAGWPGLISSYDPDVVLLLQGSSPTAAVQVDGRWAEPCTDAYESLQQQRIEEQVTALSAKGAKVVLVTGPHSTNPFRPANADRVVGCHAATVRKAAAASGAALVDLDRHLCPGGSCVLTSEGATIRPDGLHFNGKGGDASARWLVAQALRSAGLGP